MRNYCAKCFRQRMRRIAIRNRTIHVRVARPRAVNPQLYACRMGPPLRGPIPKNGNTRSPKCA